MIKAKQGLIVNYPGQNDPWYIFERIDQYYSKIRDLKTKKEERREIHEKLDVYIGTLEYEVLVRGNKVPPDFQAIPEKHDQYSLVVLCNQQDIKKWLDENVTRFLTNKDFDFSIISVEINLPDENK